MLDKLLALRKSRTFDRVVIETSGLADPAPLLRTFLELRTRGSPLRVDGTVVVADVHALLAEGGFDFSRGGDGGGGGGDSGGSGRAEFSGAGFTTFGGAAAATRWWRRNVSATAQLRRQLAFADTVVVNKLDLLPHYLRRDQLQKEKECRGSGDCESESDGADSAGGLIQAARDCVLGVVRSTAGAALPRERVLFTSHAKVDVSDVLSLRVRGDSATDDARIVALLLPGRGGGVRGGGVGGGAWIGARDGAGDGAGDGVGEWGSSATHMHVVGVRSVSLVAPRMAHTMGGGDETGRGDAAGAAHFTEAGIALADLQHFLQNDVANALGDRLLRIKGVVPIRGDRRIFVVHGVGGDLSGSFARDEWGVPGDATIGAAKSCRVARLVVIARWEADGEAAAIAAAFSQLFAVRV